MKEIRSWVKTNQGVGCILSIVLVAFLIYLQLSPWVHKKVRDGFTLGFFPVLSIVILLFFTIVMILDSHRKEITKDTTRFTLKSFLGGVGLLIATGCYFAVMTKVGFLIVTPFYLIIFMYTLGMKDWRTSVISALIMTVVVYGAFSAIGVRIPAGVLDGVLFF
jgi:hypothetical protein